MDCVICCEKKTLIKCPSCHNEACVNCIKTWILTQPSATCLHCSKPLYYSFLKQIFTQKFINVEYKNYILTNIEREENTLFDSLQQTKVYQICRLYLETKTKRLNIPFVSMNVHVRRVLLLSNDMLIVRRIAPWLYDHIENNLIIDLYYKETLRSKEQHELLFKIIRKQLREYMPRFEMINQLPDERYDKDYLINKNRFPCPVKDCKGCVLNERCILCLQKVCSDCWEIREPEHVCDPIKLYNVDDIKRNSQICPTCSVRITKSEGCNHMICTRCGTNFNYSSGKKQFENNREVAQSPTQEIKTIGRLRAVRNKADETYRLKLRLLYHLGLIDKDKFLTQNYYFWKITQLEIEEIKILEPLEDVQLPPEKLRRANEKLELLSKEYDLAPLQIDKEDPYIRRHSVSCSDKVIKEIIERFL